MARADQYATGTAAGAKLLGSNSDGSTKNFPIATEAAAIAGTGDGVMTSSIARAALDDRLTGELAFTVYAAIYGAYGAAEEADAVDESTELQAAIDYAESIGGGNVQLRPGRFYKGNVILKAGVVLVGQPGAYPYTAGGTARRTQLQGVAAGFVVDTPATSINGCGVVGIGLKGLGAATALGGIRFQNVSWGAVQDVSFDSFADQAIHAIDGNASRFADILATNCLLNRTRASDVGVIQIASDDNFLSRIEANPAGQLEGTVQSVDLRVQGVLVSGANNMLDDVIGEFGDIGIHVSGSYNRLVNCRGDLNYGHGIKLSGVANMLAACLALNNSQDTTNTYDGFTLTSASGNNTLVGCSAQSSAAKKHRYGFHDQKQSQSNKNRIIDPVSTGHTTARIVTDDYAGSAVLFASGSAIPLTANSATPALGEGNLYLTANTSATTITNFTGGVAGQEITVICDDENTSIGSGGGIDTRGGATIKLRRYYVYKFVRMRGTWRQVQSADDVSRVSADRGDAAATLIVRTDEKTQVWNTPLTAHRGITLSGSGALNGDKFRIVRTAAATGAFNLSIGSLKNLAAGQWADVEHDGSAWMLTAFGSL